MKEKFQYNTAINLPMLKYYTNLSENFKHCAAVLTSNIIMKHIHIILSKVRDKNSGKYNPTVSHQLPLKNTTYNLWSLMKHY